MICNAMLCYAMLCYNNIQIQKTRCAANISILKVIKDNTNNIETQT